MVDDFASVVAFKLGALLFPSLVTSKLLSKSGDFN